MLKLLPPSYSEAFSRISDTLKGAGSARTNLPMLPTEIELKIAHSVADAAIEDAVRKDPNMGPAERKRAAARALAPFMRTSKLWALYAETVKNDRPGIAMQATRAAIEDLAGEKDLEKFRTHIHRVLGNLKHAEVPFQCLSPEQEGVVFQELLLKANSLENLRLCGFKPENSAYVSALNETGGPRLNIAIDQSWNDIGDAEAQAILDAIKGNNSKVVSVDLSWNRISDAKMAAISTEIDASLPKLTSSDLRWNNMSEKVRNIVTQIRSATTQILDLENQNIDDTEMQAIADALKDPDSRITRIRLGHNNIGDMGAQALGGAIRHAGSKLTHIGLADNNIGDPGAQALAGAIGDSNSKIRGLNLSWNGIGNMGAQAMVDALTDTERSDKTIAINLLRNHIDEATKQAIASCRGIIV